MLATVIKLSPVANKKIVINEAGNCLLSVVSSLFDIICRRKQSWKSVMFTVAKHYNHYHNEQGWGLGWANWLGKKKDSWYCPYLSLIKIKLFFTANLLMTSAFTCYPVAFDSFFCSSLTRKWLCRLVLCIALNLHLICFSLKTDFTWWACREKCCSPLNASGC